MFLLSLLKRISNIANISRFGLDRGNAIASLPIQESRAYFLEPQPIQACKHQSVKKYSLKANDWQLELKPNSGENLPLIAILK